MGAKSDITAINEFIARVSRDFEIKKVILFGSRATETARKDSDIDLMIVSDDFGKMNFFERVSAMYDYWSSDFPVDFLCYTSNEFIALKSRISIVREALANGRIISIRE